jgi:hypothetical protein
VLPTRPRQRDQVLGGGAPEYAAGFESCFGIGIIVIIIIIIIIIISSSSGGWSTSSASNDSNGT